MLADTQALYKELQQAGVRVLDTHNQVWRQCGALQLAWRRAHAHQGSEVDVQWLRLSKAALLNCTWLPVPSHNC